MSGGRFLPRHAAALVCVLLLGGAAPADVVKPDDIRAPDVVEGDWIQPADVLLIGDSESLGYFGAQLYRSLSMEPDPKTRKPLKIWSLWTCGSDATTWEGGGTSYCGIRTCNGAGDCARDHGPLDRPGRVRYSALSEYLARVRPRVTIVSLGSNMLTNRASVFRSFTATYLEAVGSLARDISRARSLCVWIGPPQVALTTKPVKDYEQFVADVGRAATDKGCIFIDSNPLSDRNYLLRGDPEGIHYQGVGERAWETKVWGELRPVLVARLAR
jgi:hypothetical protein